jgi:transcriptional regulator GlxA family with amidase domain
MLGGSNSSFLPWRPCLGDSEANTHARCPVIGFYVFPGHAVLDLAGPLTGFNLPDYLDRPGHYETVVLSRKGGLVPNVEGINVTSVSAPKRPIDTFIVVGGPGVFELREPDFAVVRKHAKTARRVASVCTGAFLLAGAGLLNGRRATTHWLEAGRLAQFFPSVQVEADRIYVQDGPVWTSAGVTAGIDLALALIEDDLGAEMARKVARYLVVSFRRRGGQSQYSELLALDTPSDRVARTLVFAQAHLAEVLTVERLATIACLSPRQFSRAFRAETGETPAGAVERLRAEAAKARVETGSEPLETIAASVGFNDPERMRRAFVRRFGKSPQALRRESRGHDPTPASGKSARRRNVATT